MKDYEKEYKEALERAKKYRLKEDLIITQDIFPELKESDDERIKKEIISAIKEDWPGHKDWIAWLESQGEKPADKVEPKIIDWSKHIKYKPNSPSIIKENPAWSEEDERNSYNLLYFLNSNRITADDREDSIQWLKSLKDRILPQPKQEWSEEDKRCLTKAIRACEQMSDGVYDYSQGYIDAINWLKSLRPQKQWKPSEEQMEELYKVFNNNSGGWEDSIIESLYNDLKAL